MPKLIRFVGKRYYVTYQNKSLGAFDSEEEAKDALTRVKNSDDQDWTLIANIKNWIDKLWLTELFCEAYISRLVLYLMYVKETDNNISSKCFSRAMMKIWPDVRITAKHIKDTKLNDYLYVLKKSYCPPQYLEEHKNICLIKAKNDVLKSFEFQGDETLATNPL